MSVLVDTSVWSLALRRAASDLNPAENQAVRELAGLISKHQARMIGIVRQELLSGIKHAPQFERLRSTLRSFPDEPISTEDHETAASASNQCRAKGLAISVPDMLLCAVAQSRGWAIFSTDPDFAQYAKVLPIKLHLPRK